MIVFFSLQSQTNKYFIAFKNKNNNGYSVSNPAAFLSAKSIQRRINQGISIDYSDMPVTPAYVNQISAISGVTVLHRIKWLNGIVIQTTSTVALSVIQSYTYVQSSVPLNFINNKKEDAVSVNTPSSFPEKIYSYNYGSSYTQNHQLNIECLHNAGFRGDGMIIAVIDAGFYNVNNNPVFDSLLMQGRLLGTRDFVSRDTMVFEDDIHGAYVLSTMAALSPGNIIGTAPKASYWLLRSEDVSSEYPIEEYYWVRAAEFADSVGADIITSSLGYSTFDNASYNHTYAMMNGKTTPISKAALMASRKGMFVNIAAGNEGDNSWYYITAPADADSICTVGAVDNMGNVASFSSRGPTSDGRIKPDVCAMGVNTALASPNGSVTNGNGTSFATPLIAGAAACLWQAKNNLTNMQLLNLIKQHANYSSNPNNNIGWGIPDFCGAYTYIKTFGKNASYNIFPNPSSSIITIEADDVIENVLIRDILGHELLNKNIQGLYDNIDISVWSSGVYFITLSLRSKEIITDKFLKQ